MTGLVSQQIKDDFLASIQGYAAFLQLKADAAESSKEAAADSADTANLKMLATSDLFDQTVNKAAEAVTAALLSYNWANKPEDSIVANGEYSAYHHRRKAEVAAQQVLTALAGAVVFKGQWNAGSNTFPTEVSPGWMYRLNVGGTLTFEIIGTKVVSIGDYILKTDTGWTHIDEATDAVKTSRTINGKALNVDIVLTPADVLAVAIADLASQAQAEAGTDDTKWMSSLKTRQALEKMGIGWTAAPPPIVDINSFTTPTGMYRTNTSTIGTFPTANIANYTLIVTRVSATAVNQILIYVDGNMWVRGSSASTWTAWKAGTAGQHGVGASMPQAPLDLNEARLGGFYVTDNVASVNIPAGWPQARYALIVAGSETYVTQIITNNSSTSGIDVARMAVRRMRNLGTWSDWFEIWTSNNLVKQANALDSTAGRMLAVGAFGLGNIGNGIAITNVDDSTLATGLYVINSGTTGTKPAALTSVMTLMIQRFSASAITQLVCDAATNRVFHRNYNGTVWSAWSEVWTGQNLVKQTSANDSTTGRMLAVGAGGLLANAQAFIGANDADAINITGFFRVDTGMLNVPPSVLNGSLMVNYQRDATNQYQEIFERNSNARWYRRKFDGTWQLWVKMFHSDSPIADHPELASKLDIMSLQLAMAI